jgi:hypothetical protein
MKEHPFISKHRAAHWECSMTIALRGAVLLIALILQFGSLGCGADTPDREPASQRMVAQRKSSPPLPNKVRLEAEAATKAASEAAVKEAREAKARDDRAKSLRRHCMSQSEMEALLWVERHLFGWMLKNGVDVKLARARTEVATARAFDMEPANWAKRDIGAFVETNRIFEKKRDEVEQRLRAAQEHSQEVESDMIRNLGVRFDPGKYAGMYWFEAARKAEPNNPYAIAIEQERKIQHEREQIYKQFNKETPEERLGGGLAILLGTLMIGAAGGEAGLTGEAEAALGSLGEAEAALVVAESEAALTSIMEARAILIAAEEAESALVAVGEARTALVAGEIEGAAAAVEEAQAALSAKLQVNPAAALALAAVNEAEGKLDAAEKADTDLGVNERAKIDLFDYSSAHQGDVMGFLAADLKAAIGYAAQYRTSIARGEIITTKGGDKVMRKGCALK